ncbi:MAG: pyridoxine 5'-phosphate synthase [Planctomycetales bacterium]
MPELGVNIDHVATVRQARKTIEPDPAWAAVIAELAGADGITVHLREDRRHIHDRDLRVLRATVQAKLNLECACTNEMLKIACAVRPDQVTFVPERREEVTTEGGLDARGNLQRLQTAGKQLRQTGITVSLFLDPDPEQIQAAAESGAEAVELHTGRYALAANQSQRNAELKTLTDAARLVRKLGLTLHAGHGLTYRNVKPVAAIPEMTELNIGHSIVSRAVLVGLDRAVREMKQLIS